MPVREVPAQNADEEKGTATRCELQFEPDDPSNPRNWPSRVKWTKIIVFSSMAFITPLTSSMFAPAISQVMDEFNSDNSVLASLVISIYVLGFATGPLVVAPLSETYGRLPVFHCCNILFITLVVACALSDNLPMLIIFRFLSGAAGSAVINLGGGTVGDLFAQEERGKVMTMFMVGPNMGPAIGPAAGGFLAVGAGWRWTFWIVVITGGAIIVTSFFIMRETYAPVLLRRRKTGNRSSKPQDSIRQAEQPPFRRAILRPLRMLFLNPIVTLFSVYTALIYGYFYLLITTLPTVFTTSYDFPPQMLGLTYLGTAVGMLLSIVSFGFFSDWILRRSAKNSDGKVDPEIRLLPMIPGAFLVPGSLFVYGWSAHYQVFWLVPILGTAMLGAGLNSAFIAIQTYLVDAYTIHAASALAATTILRSIAGALLPLVGPKMYETMGLGWGNSLMGFLSVVFIPVPFLFVRYGKALRERTVRSF